MDKIIYSLVYNRKKSLNKKGMALVQVEAYLNRKKKYFSTKVYLSPDQWDFKKRMVKNHPNADAINHMLYEFMAEIEKKELGLWQQGKQISLDSLKNSMENQDDSTSFIAFFRNEIAKSSLKESTKRNHLSTLELLRSYKKDVSFSAKLAILRSYSNVVVTPHTAFYTDEAVSNMAENSIIGAMKFISGEHSSFEVR